MTRIYALVEKYKSFAMLATSVLLHSLIGIH